MSETPRPGDDRRLPEPGSAKLEKIIPRLDQRRIYEFLYSRIDSPPSTNELREYMQRTYGENPNQVDRRMRELRDRFDVPAKYMDGEYRYRLGVKKIGPVSLDVGYGISKKTRAQVLAPQRCAQCGRTPLEDGVKLAVDHKLPRHWGGGDDIENLQPLCVECNHGKQAFYATYDEHTEKIRHAAQFEEPHRRIGELLKAFDGDWVPSEILGVVASIGQYQEDWQKRMRELRVLGWKIESRRERRAETRRVVTYYRATVTTPWPPGSIVRDIRRLESAARKGQR
jgi:5-methylcytosine-specific restriction endonuclease McrA